MQIEETNKDKITKTLTSIIDTSYEEKINIKENNKTKLAKSP